MWEAHMPWGSSRCVSLPPEPSLILQSTCSWMQVRWLCPGHDCSNSEESGIWEWRKCMGTSVLCTLMFYKVSGCWQSSVIKWKYMPVVHILAAAAAAKSLQSCLTLCDPIDSSPPGSPIPGTLQARTLEWVAISFSSAWKWKVEVKSLSHVWLFTTSWTAAYQAPPSMGFSRQEYWSGLPLPSPEHILESSVNILYGN